jgi:hypothetical protein
MVDYCYDLSLLFVVVAHMKASRHHHVKVWRAESVVDYVGAVFCFDPTPDLRI